jgi:hypothetical protein
MITGLGILATMGIAGLTNFFIFVFGLYRFVYKQFNSRSLPAYVLFAMLVIWGTGYNWANAYHLEMFLTCLPYVGFFAFAVGFHALYYLNCYCENNRWRDLLLYTLLSVMAFVTHPITGAFCFVGALSLLLKYMVFKRTLLLQGVPLLALVVCLIWPYFNYWDVFTRGTTNNWFETPLFSNQVSALGGLLIGLPISVSYALQRKHGFVICGLILCCCIYAISGGLGILIGGRFIFFVAFFLHLATALYLSQNCVLSVRAMRMSLRTDGMVMVLACLLIVPSGICRVREMGKQLSCVIDRPFTVHNYQSPVSDYSFLLDYLSESDVVLTRASEGGIVPAITGARLVASQRLNPLIRDEICRRKADAEAFFTGELSLEERIGLIAKYNVTYILINMADKDSWASSLENHLRIIGMALAGTDKMILYRVAQNQSYGAW